MKDSDNKKEYEIAFLAKTEESAKDVLNMVKSHGAEIILEGPINKISLAYEIKKESNAYFGFAHFSSSPDEIKPLDEALRLKGDVLRHMIITPPSIKNKPRSAPSKTKPQKPTSEVKAMPLSNEALEKKIEEILSE